MSEFSLCLSLLSDGKDVSFGHVFVSVVVGPLGLLYLFTYLFLYLFVWINWIRVCYIRQA